MGLKTNYKKLPYRPEIDGLRALAIFLVFGYHIFENETLTLYGFTPFSGGFIGVDIFFVISGYLITLIIINEYKRKQFNFFSFMFRRIRRIVPALLLLSFFILLLGIFLLLPMNLIDISYSFLSLSVFFSNFYFFLSGKNYSALEQFPQPFIHSWSLSVEWQFYLLFPFFLLFILKKIKKKKRFIQTSIFISFVLTIFLNYIDQSLSFFLILSRFWEFFAGVMIAFLPKKRSYKKKYFFYSLTGLFIILFYSFGYNENLNHPSFFTIFPIFGLYLLLRYFHNFNPITNFFKFYPIRYVGLSSYSIYLYHYPLISFTRIIFDKNDSNFFLIGFLLVFLIFFFSFMSYEFVEKPFRNKKIIDKKLFLKSNLLLLSLCLFISIIILKNKGFEDRWKISQNYTLDNRFYENEWYKIFKENKKTEFKNNEKIKVLVMGDSHANDFFNMFNFNKNLYNDFDFAYLNSFDVDIKNEKILRSDYIILSKAWKTKDLDSLKTKIDILVKYKKKVFLTSHNVTFPLAKFDFTISDKFLNSIGRLPNEAEQKDIENLFFINRNKHKEINNELERISIDKQIVYFNKYNYLCSDLKQRCIFLTDNFSKIYFDEDHYTVAGAEYLGKIFFANNGMLLLGRD
tara:strand:+ start:2775 stop:4658 length:1884 start_codon:yes stop_codon:yes gene_type:complete